MLLMQNTIIKIWKVLTQLNPNLSIFLIITFCLLVIFFLLFLIAKYMWKVIVRIYEVLLYFIVGNILYSLIKMNAKPTFLLWDNLLYTNLYAIDTCIKGNYSKMVNTIMRSCKRFSLFAYVLLLGIILLNSMNISILPQMFAVPLSAYLDYEQKIVDKYALDARIEKEADVFVITDTEIIDTSDTIDEVIIYYKLSSEGVYGSNIREAPGTASNIVTSVSGDIRLEFLNEEITKQGTTWLKIKTEDDSMGWISKKLVEEITEN